MDPLLKIRCREFDGEDGKKKNKNKKKKTWERREKREPF